MTDQPTTEFVFEDPPSIQRGGGGYGSGLATELAPLLEHPGQWVRIRSGLKDTQARSIAYRIKKDLSIDDGYFDTAARKQNDGTGSVYVRYTPGARPVNPVSSGENQGRRRRAAAAAS